MRSVFYCPTPQTFLLLRYKANLMPIYQAAQIDERVTHTAQGGVDADALLLGNLAEGKVLVEPKADDFLLVFGHMCYHTVYGLILL